MAVGIGDDSVCTDFMLIEVEVNMFVLLRVDRAGSLDPSGCACLYLVEVPTKTC